MILGSAAAAAYKYNQEHGHIMHGGLYGMEGFLGKDNWTAGRVGAAPLENDPEKTKRRADTIATNTRRQPCGHGI